MFPQERQRNTGILSEIPQITLGTSYQDIMQKRSSMNPYPERGENGIDFWNGELVFGYNPTATLRYKKTRDMFIVTIPFLHPVPMFHPVSLNSENEPKPRVMAPSMKSFGKWISSEHMWAFICLEYIREKAHKQDLDPLLDEASQIEKDSGAKEASSFLVKTAIEEINAGNWMMGMNIAEPGLSQVRPVFNYLSRISQLIYPDLRGPHPEIDNFYLEWEDRFDIAFSPLHVSSNIMWHMIAQIRDLAISRAIEDEKDPIVKGNYQLVKNHIQRTISQFEKGFKLLNEYFEIKKPDSAIKLLTGNDLL